jgi:hypothetical protein
MSVVYCSTECQKHVWKLPGLANWDLCLDLKSAAEILETSVIMIHQNSRTKIRQGDQLLR